MEILHLEMEPTARNIIGETSGLEGLVRIRLDGASVEFALSQKTIGTIRQCVECDFDAFLKGLQELRG